MNSKHHTALTEALDCIVRNERKRAARLLCFVLGLREVPHLLPALLPTPPVHRRDAPVRAHRGSAGAQPKPATRVVDPACLAQFRAAHPCCVVDGCTRPSTAHHIKRRGQHGDDVATNLAALCMRHHTGDEGVDNRLKFPTPAAWLAVYGDQLPAVERAKWACALGMKMEEASCRSTP